MADFEYRNIYTEFWEDPWVVNDLKEPEDKLIFIFLFSNKNSKLTGVYPITKGEIALRTGTTVERVEQALALFASLRKAFYDEGSGHVWVVALLKRSVGKRLNNPNIQTHLRNNLDKIPVVFQEAWLKYYNEYLVPLFGVEPLSLPQKSNSNPKAINPLESHPNSIPIVSGYYRNSIEMVSGKDQDTIPIVSRERGGEGRGGERGERTTSFVSLSSDKDTSVTRPPKKEKSSKGKDQKPKKVPTKVFQAEEYFKEAFRRQSAKDNGGEGSEYVITNYGQSRKLLGRVVGDLDLEETKKRIDRFMKLPSTEWEIANMGRTIEVFCSSKMINRLGADRTRASPGQMTKEELEERRAFYDRHMKRFPPDEKSRSP